MGKFQEEWLLPEAIIPVNSETIQSFVEEIKRMTVAVGNLMLQQAINQPKWVGLTQEEINELCEAWYWKCSEYKSFEDFLWSVDAKLKEKNT